MLDRLPVELVQHVVRLALPSPSHATYRERQDTLLALSRTSRALRTVAQPALFEFVELASREQVDSFREAVKAKELGARVRSVQLDGDEYDSNEGMSSLSFEADDFASLASACPDLFELKTHKIDVDASWLETFPCLTRLVFSHGTLFSLQPFVLHNLVELSVMCGNVVSAQIFDALAYPCLRAVHLQLSDNLVPDEAPIEGLIGRLDAFSCDSGDVAHSLARVPLSGLRSRSLLDFDIWTLAEDPAANRSQLGAAVHVRVNAFALSVRIMRSELRGSAMFPGVSQDFAQTVQDGGAPNLRTLILPSFANLSRLPLKQSDAWPAIQTLVSACESRGIDVVFEPTPHPYYDSLVSPEFWRRCKALKAKEEEVQVRMRM
ncbi:hypothetical protein JCM10213v2_008676 [Rhodosporidiobolus nylandii]